LFDITAGGDAGDLIEERRAFPPGVNYIAIPAAAASRRSRDTAP
jgi:hypothetical protein